MHDCWEVDDALTGILELTTCKFKNIKTETINMHFLSTLAYLSRLLPLIATKKDTSLSINLRKRRKLRIRHWARMTYI